VDIEVTPEPTEEEREALLRALASLNGHAPAPSPWWQAGVLEALGEDPEER
jgi:hypothetical protein